MKIRLRKPVALLGTLVMAGAFLVTGSAGVANAAPAGPERETNGDWRVSRTVSNSTPSAGDTITVSSVFERRWGGATLQVVKDIHPSCLELVPGSVTFRGSTVTTNRIQDEQNDPSEPGFGYVRVTGINYWIEGAAGSGWKNASEFKADYKVTPDCVRDVPLRSNLHYGANIQSRDFPMGSFNGGPSITVQKDATSVALAADPTSAVVDEDVTFNVTTFGIGNGESVAISGDGTGAATATVTNNTATFTRSFGSTGTKNVQVVYAGSAIAHPAGPASATVEVGKIPSEISIAAADPAMAGSPVPLTAIVTGIPDGQPLQFSVNGQSHGPANVADGTAIYTGWTPTTAGNYTIRATYAGSATVAGSQSPQVGVTVIDPVQQTSTTLAVDQDPVPGRVSTLTATVTGGKDGDTVEFFNNGQRLDTATLDGGVASIEWTPTAGQATQPYSLTARYVGSTGYLTSTSPAVAGIVGLVQTSVSDVTAPASATVGKQVQLSATVTGGTPGQNIVFRDGETVLDTVGLSSGGVATAYWTPTATGDYQVTAHYPGTSTTTSSSSPNATTVNVQAGQSTVTLTASSPVSVGQTTTLTADTTGIADGQSISFQVGGTEFGTGLVANDQVTYAWTPTTTGNYTITAVYAGSDTVTGSESDTVTVEVTETATSTSAVTASANPVTGEPVSLSAIVTDGTQGVDVVFRAGDDDLCTAQLAADGTASCQWTPSQIGTLNVTAHYAGDGTTSASQSQIATTVAVGQGAVAAPSGLVVTPANPTAADTITVSGTAPAGSEVSVYTFDGQHECFATADSNGAFSCELGALPAGQHQIQAFATLNGVMSQQASTLVTVTVAATSIQLTGPGSVQPGQAADLTITTTGIADGEQVDIAVNGTGHGTATVTGGAASYQWSSASAGTFEIVAAYDGSDSAEPAESEPLTITVDEAATQTSRVTARTSATIGGAVALSATVTRGVEGVDVEFRNGADLLCTGEVGADGAVACDWIPTAAGTVTVRAHYLGDDTTGASQSTTATSITVVKALSTVALTASSPVVVGGTVTFTVNTTGVPDGKTVDIAVDGNPVASPTVSGGTATAIWTAPAMPATLTAIAEYAGNDAIAGSESEQVSIEVGKSATSTSGVTAGPSATVGVAVPLTATVTGGVEDVTVEFRNGTATLCTDTLAADGTVSCQWTPTAPGPVTVTAHYLGDASTAASDSENGTSITVAPAPDTEAPAAPTGISVQPQPATAGQSVTVTGTAEAGSSVSVMVDGAEVCDATATGGAFSCSFPVTEQMDGQSVTATATDAANNTSGFADGGTLRVDPVAVDPTVPTITVTPAQPVAGEKVQIELTGDAGEVVVVTNGDTEICRVALGQDGTAICEWTPDAGGQVTLKVTAGDQTVEKTVTVRPADDGGDVDDDDAEMGSLGSLFGGTGGTGSSGSLSSLGG